MRKFYALIFICFFITCGHSQTFGNEWINYNQKYYAINVVQSGIYKIDYNTLASSGVPLTTFYSSNIQIFGRQKEIPIHIEDGGDNIFGLGDYFLFYGERNDGWLDSTLYNNTAEMGNPKYSLYNDTIQYFFTWNNSSNNNRFVIETDVNYDGFIASDFVEFETFTFYNQQYNEGEKSADASSSFFVEGEGWGRTPQNGATNSYTWDMSTTQLTNIYQGLNAPNIKYNAVVVGTSNAAAPSNQPNHRTRHTIGSSNFVIYDTTFTGYKAVTANKSIPASDFPSSGNLGFKVQIVNSLGVATDFQSLNFWSFRYPRIPSFANASKLTFKVYNSSNQNKIRLNISNVNMPNPTLFVFGTVARKIPLSSYNGDYVVVIPNNGSIDLQQVVIEDATSFINVSNLRAVNGTGDFTNFTAIPNIDEALLFIYNKKLKNKTLEYAAYRSSASGGSYNVILADIEELYQQYGGGIQKHINGLRRFAHKMYVTSTVKPVGLFLVGKGIREANITSATNLGPGSRTNAAAYANNLIPTFGQPSCDVCITSNLPQTDKFTPLIPTGRISVISEDELQIYFSKVIQYEEQQKQNSVYSSPTKDWQKQLLHFAGGTSVAEQSQFQDYLTETGDIAEGDFFAGNTRLIKKESSSPITPSELQSIKNRISDGVSVMNFFGHFTTSESGFDVNLDEPQFWNNQGKYPILLANSCYNGNIFHNSTSNSQNFVLAPNGGVIAYIGTINYGFSYALNSFSKNFYKQFSTYNYGGTIGEHIKNTIDSVLTTNPSLITEATFCQMTLNGDPMLRLNYHNKPEIELTESRVNFGPENISYATDSIEVKIQLRNLGKSIIDTFNIEIKRDFPNSLTDSVYNIKVFGMDYEKLITKKMPFQPTIGIGLNKFTISVDIPNLVAEQYDESANNRIIRNFFIGVDGIEPIQPTDFAVVPSNQITVYASTLNPMAELQTYRFEIDTLPTFNSNFKRFAEISEIGGVKSVNPNQWKLASNNQLSSLILEDSIVYYWRVALVEPTLIWKQRSFQYIQNKSGWGQADYHQFTANNLSGLTLNSSTEFREFQPNYSDISCLALAATPGANLYENAWYLNGIQQDYNICTVTPKFQVAVIDRSTLTAWETRFTYSNGTVANPNNNFGNANDNGGCEQRPMKFFTYNQNNATQLAAFRNLVENEVPFGDYILIYSPITTRYDWLNTFDPAVFQTFANLGSDSIVPGRANRPFIFLTRKGDPNFVVELCSQNNEPIFLDTLISGVQSFGVETSTVIGPVADWKSLYWNYKKMEANSQDSTKLEVQVLNAYGTYQFSIYPTITSGDSLLNLDNLIDANLYPNIRLVAKYNDNINLTPSQLQNWHVVYSPLPEAAIDGTAGITWIPNMDSIQEGNQAKFAVNIRNISNVSMDSLLVNYYITDANQVRRNLTYPRKDSLGVGETLRDTILISTNGLIGANWFNMEVNPYVDANLTLLDQPELSHLNNVLQFPFKVVGENKNPLLDVIVNGRHIMNKDIVAPTSEIVITLKDENPFLVMNSDADTSLFGIYLTDPDGIQKRIYFTDNSGNQIMSWIPATTQNKKFKIIFPTYFEKSGTYSLLVQGTDRSGNLSGDLEYKISFEVIHESMISQMMNYPNPFSTSTRFVYTITGDAIPDDIQIQIMTVSGKVVREINEAELGPIQIGRNVSSYAWDGKDQFGDPLANGVYLYRVKTRINGKEIKQLETGADNYFHKGLGKMYLIR